MPTLCTLQGREIQAASGQKALLADGTICPKVVHVPQGKKCREGLEETVPQRPAGQLEEEQDGGCKEPCKVQGWTGQARPVVLRSPEERTSVGIVRASFLGVVQGRAK